MKQALYFLLPIFIVGTSCHTTKNTSNTTTPHTTNMKGNLIDGTWEANYIMNAPKSFTEIYPKVKPTITFNSQEGKVSGVTGCNNFNASFTMDGNKLSLGELMAVTRKMCPDMTGEQIFLETLKKVNTYSVTEQGKTLNLIMGDMAVMRLVRKQAQ